MIKKKEWNDFQINHPEIIQRIGEKKIENSNNGVKNYNIIQILSFPSQRRKIILLCGLWFASGMNFFGILLNLGHMKGNFFFKWDFIFFWRNNKRIRKWISCRYKRKNLGYEIFSIFGLNIPFNI